MYSTLDFRGRQKIKGEGKRRKEREGKLYEKVVGRKRDYVVKKWCKII